MNDFSNMLTNFQRDNLFILKIFIPASIPGLGTALGPSIFIIALTIFISQLKNFNIPKNPLIVCASQLFLLMLF